MIQAHSAAILLHVWLADWLKPPGPMASQIEGIEVDRTVQLKPATKTIPLLLISTPLPAVPISPY